MPYKIIQKPKKVEHPFGEVHEIYRTETYNIARAVITDDREHYHRKATEIYYVMSGKGKMKLGKDEIKLHPHMTIVIEPWTRHRATADEGKLDILVFSSPPYDPRDEFY